jgi:phage terminase small subunit
MKYVPPEEIAAVFHLTPRQAAFVAAYLGSAYYRANRAALAAGYCPTSPRQAGYQVKRSPKVRRAIDRLTWCYIQRRFRQNPRIPQVGNNAG